MGRSGRGGGMSAAVAERITDLFNGDMPDDANWLELLLKNRLDQLPYPAEGERWNAGKHSRR